MFGGKILRASVGAALFLTSSGLSFGLQAVQVPAAPQTAPPMMAMPPVSTPATVLPAPPVVCPRPACAVPTLTVPAPYVAPAPSLPCAQAEEAALQETMKQFRRGLEPGQRIVMVQALCVQVPAGFCEQAGLSTAPGHAGCGPWVLTPRESKMFGALLRATPNKDIVTRPTMVIADQETGCVQVGQQVPVVSATETVTKNGETLTITKMEMRPVGVTLQVTPKVGDDGQAVLLRVQGQISTLESTMAPMPIQQAGGEADGQDNGVRAVAYAPAFNVQQFQTTVEVSEGWTAVICTGTKPIGPNKQQVETLWVLTTHPVMGGQK
jgi:hypothetical protein